MILEIYIYLSIIISLFAVHDYRKSAGSTKVLFLFGIWVFFAILWPFVIVKSIRDLWRTFRVFAKRRKMIPRFSV